MFKSSVGHHHREEICLGRSQDWPDFFGADFQGRKHVKTPTAGDWNPVGWSNPQFKGDSMAKSGVKSQHFPSFMSWSPISLWLGEAAYWHQSLIYSRHEHPRFCWKSINSSNFSSTSVMRHILPRFCWFNMMKSWRKSQFSSRKSQFVPPRFSRFSQ